MRPMGLSIRRVVAAAIAGAALGTSALAQDAASVPAAITPADAAQTTGASAAPAERARSLAELVALAERHYPGFVAASAEVANAEARLREAHISPFSQFTMDLGAAVVPNASGTPIFTPNGQLGDLRAWGPAASVSVSGAIPLFTFGKLREAWHAAEAGVTAAERGEDRVRMQVTFDVRRAYFGLTFALDVLQMISEGESKLENAVERFDERIEEGDTDLDPMDRFRLASALAEVRARHSQAIFAEEAARRALEALTGLESITIADCPSDAVGIALPSADELAEASSARPELGMLAAARDARAADLRIHRARFYPDLVLGLSALYTTSPGVTDISNPFIQDRANNRGLGFGLAARWSLDFAGNRQRVLGARARLTQIGAQLDEARLGTELEVRVARERFEDASRRLRAWQDGERQTRQWFVSAAQGYQVGTVEPKQLVDALKAYFTARYSRLEAVFDHNLALAQLARISGTELAPQAAWEPRCE